MVTFGQRLRILRTASSMTQNELADRIGATKQAISQYEHGKRTPDLDTLLFLCDLFGVTADYILGRTPYDFLSTQTPDEKEILLAYRQSDDLRKELTKMALGMGRKESGGLGGLTSVS